MQAAGGEQQDASSSDDEDVDPEDAKDAQRNTATRTAYRGDEDDEALQQAALQDASGLVEEKEAEDGDPEGTPEGDHRDAPAKDASRSMQTEVEVRANMIDANVCCNDDCNDAYPLTMPVTVTVHRLSLPPHCR